MRRSPNQLRIVGGRWRGRRLTFPDLPGLRPTPDRVRETVFNWLQAYVDGARCLDLFAGSGAMGLEALSRGAAGVTLVDQASPAVAQLRQNLGLLGAQGAELVQADALGFLSGPPQAFDIVFLDPPFRQDLLAPCLQRLDQGWLAPGARIYMECEAEAGEPPLPAGWQLLKHKRAGQVGYYLAARA